ncbi:hypothetical protein FPCIR_12589 [Fusarium pseudocircinatum]|uniref:Uncharacterized protein n=1 Tax=Fusarium pseudocircinatum TaxID=56676 RepID=A0A8H5KQA5_9HYPO|nr:hypothetical protein FPCIR_12589 [Fusarium pseudocircinatum]
MFVIMARVCKADKECKADRRANDAPTDCYQAGDLDALEVPARKKKSSRLFWSYCKKANHTFDTYRAVPGTVTILSGGGPRAPTGCTFRLATGRIEKKKTKKNNKKKKANETLANKVSKEVEAMQLE